MNCLWPDDCPCGSDSCPVDAAGGVEPDAVEHDAESWYREWDAVDAR